MSFEVYPCGMAEASKAECLQFMKNLIIENFKENKMI